MNINFTSRIALVTGAGKGIGRCIALKLSKLGAKVYAVSRTEADLDSLKVEDPSIETRCLDIRNWDNTRKVIEDVRQVDLLVNNAAILRFKTVLETTEELIDEHFDINFKAALNISQIVAKGIISRKGSGAIVNISSIGGILTYPGDPVYCTTKAALDMLTKSMALEFGPLKIRVNSCNPGVVSTPMSEMLLVSREQRDAFTGRIPMGRIIEQDEVANTVAFLLSDYASMINGALVPVDGGHSIHMSPNPVK
ncbi:L-xylulose reductase-like isoform X2 [Mytilus californianus]|uniref:L-xylulose reductase-like isoform X2 n=1 Tax=Mytilus californianus TaxID=6549 RepID=UPI002246D93E|nr:L-xylulose reductase-like isoform X2 [Mytilus californianus]